ncbi:hypothetical protein IQ06DRAFT_234155 [Phaeosphaeriaceae sp. SRC1lsM3a]|nr:hypothetical protein IQ06DRAFT_234155 [Stagonospora sp. SRC1lsM3a]
MCWCFSFGFSSKKKPSQKSSSGEKKRRDGPDESLHGRGKTVVAEVSEKRKSGESHRKRRSGDSTSPRSSRREREEQRPTSKHYYDDAYRSRESYRPSLNVQVPEMWHRSVDQGSTNSSQEALLNPRPHRSTHQRQRHPKQTPWTLRHAATAHHASTALLNPHLTPRGPNPVAELHVSTSARLPARAKRAHARPTRPPVACPIAASPSSQPRTRRSRTYEEKHLRSPRLRHAVNDCDVTRA